MEIEEHVWNTEDPLWNLLMLPSPMNKISGEKKKLIQVNYWWSRPFNKGWITLPGKEHQSAEVFAEGKRKTERVVEKDSYVYQVRNQGL